MQFGQIQITSGAGLNGSTEATYVLRPWGNQRFGRKYAFAEVDDPQIVGDNRENGVCPTCGGGLGNRPWMPPQRAKLSRGALPDFLWGAGFDLALSAQVVELYGSHGLSGLLRVDPPIEIVNATELRQATIIGGAPVYHNVLYAHGGADLDDARSGARRPQGLCSRCRAGIERLDRVIIKPGTWTGCDIFSAFGLDGAILVTSRFAALIAEHELTNGQLIPAEDYHLDFGKFPPHS